MLKISKLQSSEICQMVQAGEVHYSCTFCNYYWNGGIWTPSEMTSWVPNLTKKKIRLIINKSVLLLCSMTTYIFTTDDFLRAKNEAWNCILQTDLLKILGLMPLTCQKSISEPHSLPLQKFMEVYLCLLGSTLALTPDDRRNKNGV